MKNYEKSKKLFNAIGEVGDDKIEKSEENPNYVGNGIELRRIKFFSPQIAGMMAAALVLVAGTVFMMNVLKPDDVSTTTDTGTSAVTTTADAANTNNTTQTPPATDKLQILNPSFDGGIGGYESYRAYDINDLENGNPWVIDNDLTTLPVFRNKLATNQYGFVENPMTAEELREKAIKVADALGLTDYEVLNFPTQEQIDQAIEKLTYGGMEPSEEALQAYTGPLFATVRFNSEDDENVIEIWNDGITLVITPENMENSANENIIKKLDKIVGLSDKITVRIRLGQETGYDEFQNAATDGDDVNTDIDTNSYTYDKGIDLSNHHNFSYYDLTAEEAREVTLFLLEWSGNITNIENPGVNTFAHLDMYGRQVRLWYSVFENSGTLTEKILNWNFNNMAFSPNEAGELSLIKKNYTDLSDKIGDYPIISASEAQRLLLDGKSLTNAYVDGNGLNAGDLARVELIYRANANEEVFMPYYKFYVKYSETSFDSTVETIKEYVAFYVPAISGDYLEIDNPLYIER
ncbi:MAG: hypothetical protein FWF82_00200 [Oscillospiraceae bacterium]|nr:hypothetical protein [Oscillospiraceae bacterium]